MLTPCKPRETINPSITPDATLLGAQQVCCGYINMGNNHYVRVCGAFMCHGGGSDIAVGPSGQMLQGTFSTASAMEPTVGPSNNLLPYCDEVSFIDEATTWVKQNPVLSFGIAAAAAFLIFK